MLPGIIIGPQPPLLLSTSNLPKPHCVCALASLGDALPQQALIPGPVDGPGSLIHLSLSGPGPGLPVRCCPIPSAAALRSTVPLDPGHLTFLWKLIEIAAILGYLGSIISTSQRVSQTSIKSPAMPFPSIQFWFIPCAKPRILCVSYLGIKDGQRPSLIGLFIPPPPRPLLPFEF